MQHAIYAWAYPANDVGPMRLAMARGLKQAVYAWSHPANCRGAGHRIRAILRLVCFQVRGRVFRGRTIVPIGTRSVIWADPRHYATVKVVCANPPDYPEMLAWSQFLRPGDIFVDVGANVGTYSIWAADLGAKVIALEPAEETYGLLAENVQLNGYDIRTIMAAAGPACGTTRFTRGLDDQNHIDFAGSAEVKVITIDSIIRDRKIAGMKVDVEGFEADVLHGSERALS
jgi:FkbM family methyltransferase